MRETELLALRIVERWDDLGGRERPWAPLDQIHKELFAGRELTPVDYAAVEEAHWKIYSLGRNLYATTDGTCCSRAAGRRGGAGSSHGFPRLNTTRARGTRAPNGMR